MFSLYFDIIFRNPHPPRASHLLYVVSPTFMQQSTPMQDVEQQCRMAEKPVKLQYI